MLLYIEMKWRTNQVPSWLIKMHKTDIKEKPPTIANTCCYLHSWQMVSDWAAYQAKLCQVLDCMHDTRLIRVLAMSKLKNKQIHWPSSDPCCRNSNLSIHNIKGNPIEALFQDGTWTKNEQELGAEVEEYYKNLCGPGVQCLEEILDGIPHSITDQINNNLTKPAEEKGVKKALFSMHPNKAPGLDEMSHFFF